MNSELYKERLTDLQTTDNVTVDEVLAFAGEVLSALVKAEKELESCPDLSFVGDEGIK